MNRYNNGKGIGSAQRKFEVARFDKLEAQQLRVTPQAPYKSQPEWEDGKELFYRKTLPSIGQTARQIAPLAVRALVGAVPEARALANPVVVQLLYPLIQRGDRKTRQKEAEFFLLQGAEVEVADTEVARAAALTEIWATRASQAHSESEAATLIGKALSLSVGAIGDRRSLRPVLPLLLVATIRLVRFLHRYSPASRLLLRLVPTILRRTVASLLVARQWGCPMTSALVGCLMTFQTKRVLGNDSLVTQSIIRNAAIRASTFAAATRIDRSREPFSSALRNGGFYEPVSDRDRQFQQFTRRDRTMTLFEAPTVREKTYSSQPYTNPESADPWATPEVNPYNNPEYEEEWEYPEMTQYTNPEYEEEWEYPEMAQYTNPEYEEEWEYPEMTQYANPEYEVDGEYPEMTQYANPEWEDEGEYFFGGLKRLAKRAFKGIKGLVKTAVPFAKKILPGVVGSLATMIPGAGVVAGPLAAKLTRTLVREGEMEAAQMEAEFFGSNAAEAEVADTEIAQQAALTEFLAAEAADTEIDSEALATIGSTLPITITIMRGQKALKRVMPILAQANAKLSGTLRRQGPLGKQLLRTVPTIQRRAVATLKAASRSGKPITGPLAAKAMAAATQQVLGNPATVERAIVRNARLRHITAQPTRRTAASRCPTCATARR